jgi:PAS domain S-box-containing protein
VGRRLELSVSNWEGEPLDPQAFPRGGGQMGRLIRAYDWSTTALGPLHGWPFALQTATELLLNAPIPMVMLWGADGVMIYNDAYSAFAGRRHPALLGSKVLEGWDEAAEFNARVLAEGLSGRTLSFKDQKLSLDRHGAAEEVWMDLDYGPVFDEQGDAAGVLATVVETTARVRAEQALYAERQAALEANRRLTSESSFLKELFEQAPGFMAITSGPGHVVTLANQAYRRLVGERAVLGRPIALALPELALQGFIQALDQAYATAEPFIGQGVRMELHRGVGRDAEERQGLRVLVVEDEMTIALLLEDMLIDLGHDVRGPAMRLPQALDLAERLELDFAILDINLDGQSSFLVADVLPARGVPFIFASGYGAQGLEPPY